jgi:4'-phosphopantetheinyl transferase
VLPAKWLEQETPLSVQRQWLTADELRRFQEFHHRADRLRMVAGRFVLRQCLQDFYGLSHARFSYGENKKPLLTQFVTQDDAHALPLDLNLTHDRQHVLAAFSMQGEVGIDVASLLDFDDWPEFAADYLTAHEIAWVQNAPATDQPLRALRFWTLKEAILKSTGHGLDIDPREIVLRPDAQCPIMALPLHLPPVSAFGLYEWQIDARTYAALASVTAPFTSTSNVISRSAAELHFVQISAKPLTTHA